MRLECDVVIAAPKPSVWRVVTDIDSAAETVSGIDAVEVLERPATGLVGLKWRETRTMFGKTATEVMTIVEAVENSHYVTEAHNHGALYRSRISLGDAPEGTRLTMEFAAETSSKVGALLAKILGPLFEGASRKAMLQDLADIKRAAESRGAV